MTLLDGLLLAAALLAGGAWIWPTAPARLCWALTAVVALLAALQALSEGLWWQFAGAGLAVAATVALGARLSRGRAPGRWGWIGRAAWATAFIGLTLGPWLLIAPAIPMLGALKGPYPVGAAVFRWVDADRPEPATEDPSDRRNVIAQAWYPATAEATGPTAPYIDGLEALPKSVSGVPRLLMRGYGHIDTHARLGAPLSPDRSRWPVVLLSPGNGAPRAFYSGLAAQLASRGVVVLAFDHPYESAVTRLADGRVVVDADGFWKVKGEPARNAFMVAEQALRAGDLRFGLSRLLETAPFAGHIDPAHMIAAGHSFGGAAAVIAAVDDPRLAGAVNIDGTFYGDLDRLDLKKPFMLVESDLTSGSHGDRFRAGAERMLATTPAGVRLEVTHAHHFSFTDGLLFFAPPARTVLATVFGASRDTRSVQALTAALLEAFATGGPSAAEAVARKDGGVKINIGP